MGITHFEETQMVDLPWDDTRSVLHIHRAKRAEQFERVSKHRDLDPQMDVGVPFDSPSNQPEKGATLERKITTKKNLDNVVVQAVLL